jgi:hypothetical protein
LLGVFLVLVLIFFLVALFMWGLKYAIAYAINAVIGFFALYAIQAFVAPSLVINIWSVSLVAIFGLLGFLIVLLLHWAGWMF